jgi:hypothetical protein
MMACLAGNAQTINVFRYDRQPRDSVFICYAHEDKSYRDELRKILAPHEQEGRYFVFDDTDILPGQQWDQKIADALSRAKVGVLLVSPDFLASDYIRDKELAPLLHAASNNEVKIFWILARPCAIEKSPIAEYQAAHDPNVPLSLLSSETRQAELVKICRELDKSFSPWSNR